MTSSIVRNQYVKYSIKDLIQLLYYQYYTIRFTIDILLIVSKASPQCSCLRQICTSCPHTTDILLCWQCSSHSLRSGNTAHLYCLKMENTDKLKKHKHIGTKATKTPGHSLFPPNLYCYCLNKVYGQNAFILLWTEHNSYSFTFSNRFPLIEISQQMFQRVHLLVI